MASNEESTGSTELKSYISSTRDGANGICDEVIMLSFICEAKRFPTPTGLIVTGSTNRGVWRWPQVCAPGVHVSCVLRPTRYIATRIDNALNGVSKRKQNACAHCIHETNV